MPLPIDLENVVRYLKNINPLNIIMFTKPSPLPFSKHLFYHASHDVNGVSQ